MKQPLRYLTATAAGAVLYPLLEILWRGYTHPSMAAAGGLCALSLYAVNDRTRHASLPLRILTSAVLITFVELCFGVLFNLVMGMEVWDYSAMPGQLLGQICLPYFLLWILLATPVCLLFARISDRFRP